MAFLSALEAVCSLQRLRGGWCSVGTPLSLPTKSLSSFYFLFSSLFFSHLDSFLFFNHIKSFTFLFLNLSCHFFILSSFHSWRIKFFLKVISLLNLTIDWYNFCLSYNCCPCISPPPFPPSSISFYHFLLLRRSCPSISVSVRLRNSGFGYKPWESR